MRGRVWTWLTERPGRTDALIAVPALTVGLAGSGSWGLATGVHYRAADVGSVLLAVAMTAPLAWRRVRPQLVLVVAGTAEFVNVVAGYGPGLAWLAVLFAVYSLAVYRSHRSQVWPLAVWAAEVAALTALAPHRDDPWNLAGVLAVTAVVWVRGDWTWARRRDERREREQQARLAVVSERARIARELHDVVAHALGIIVMQAGGAGTVPRLDDAEAKRVLATIERTGRQAFVEMRRLVGVLRDDDDPPGLDPQPTVATLPALVAEMADAGLLVSLDVEGKPPGIPGVELSAYRIVQEALTNTLKHVGPTHARVRVAWRPDCVAVEVDDDGPAGDTSPRPTVGADRGGQGLVGMRERVAIYGGDLQAGPRPQGGFRVAARLPLVES